MLGLRTAGGLSNEVLVKTLTKNQTRIWVHKSMMCAKCDKITKFYNQSREGGISICTIKCCPHPETAPNNYVLCKID